MVKYSNRGLSNDPSNLWLFGVLYWILYLSLEVWTQSILLGKFFLVERDYLTFSKQAIRYLYSGHVVHLITYSESKLQLI